jgi:Zn-dependent M28 family amino/carboxypeptidase
MAFRIPSLSFLILFFCLFGLVRDVRVPGMMDEISVKTLKEHVQNIHFVRDPDDHYPDLERAALYIHHEFLRMGLTVRKDSFQWGNQWFHNVVAEKRGISSPDQIFLVGAHYDTVPGSPGADDNASAVAVLLEVARNIQRVTVGCTIRFIAFSLEECGYIGSTHYAGRAKTEGEKIAGMISLEMVGFTDPKQCYPSYLNPKYYPNIGDFIGVVGNEKSEGLLQKVRRSLKAHIPQLPAEFLLVPGNGDGMEEVRLSDHSPFWDQGYEALLITDTAFLRNPNYHLPMDTIETLDFEFMRKVAVGVFHAMIDLAK